MPGRFAFVLGALLAGLFGWSWSHARSVEALPPVVPPEISPGSYCRVDVSGDATTIELPESAPACDLIVSSLGDSSATYGIQLAAETGARMCARLHVVSDLHRPASFPVRTIGSEDDSDLVVPHEAVASSACAPANRTFHLHVADLPLEDPARLCADRRLPRG